MTSSRGELIALAVAGGVLALLVAYVVARRLMAAGYTWADALAAEAVTVIGGIGAVQSYTALRWLALLGDLDEWLADVAPATVDLFAVVMGLAALRARRAAARDPYAYRLALGYSVAAVLANLAAAGLDVAAHPSTPHQAYPAARAVVVLLAHTALVVTFLLGSHWLMRRPGRPDMAVDTAADVRQAAAATGAAAPPSPATSTMTAATVDEGADTGEDIARTPAQPNHRAGASASPSTGRQRRRPARATVPAMVRRRGTAVTVADVVARTGPSGRHVARLLAEVRRPRLAEAGEG